MRNVRTLILLGCVLVQMTGAGKVWAAGSIADALPAGSQLLAQDHLQGVRNVVAIVYRHHGDFVGIAQTSGDVRIVSQVALRGKFQSLRIPGIPGVIEVTSRGTGGGQWLCAFSTPESVLRPAIKKSKDGCVFAPEDIRFHPNGFSVRSRDTNHAGSVHYRLITRYTWIKSNFVEVDTTRVPDYGSADLPKPRGLVQTRTGNEILLKLEVAATPQEQQIGLMYRRTLDADSGMIFAWQQPVRESFWMENTYIPLSIAFLSSDGIVQEIQTMQPLTTDLHTPAQDYQYAIEMNQDFFANNGIRVGDRITLTL